MTRRMRKEFDDIQ